LWKDIFWTEHSTHNNSNQILHRYFLFLIFVLFASNFIHVYFTPTILIWKKFICRTFKSWFKFCNYSIISILHRFYIGLSDRSIPDGKILGECSNSYGRWCLNSKFWLPLKKHDIEWSEGVTKPEWDEPEIGDIYGCGLLLSPDNKLAIFFTLNGILLGEILFKCMWIRLNVYNPQENQFQSASALRFIVSIQLSPWAIQMGYHYHPLYFRTIVVVILWRQILATIRTSHSTLILPNARIWPSHEYANKEYWAAFGI
jgi:hypothetical protein